MLFALVQRFLGTTAVVVLVALAGFVSLCLYMLRFQRPLLAKVYSKPVFKQLIDIVCRITANQSPIESNALSPLPPEIMLREYRDFPWAARKLKDKVIGFDTTIDTMIRCLRDRIALRVQSPGSTQKALAKFLFIGPDGIGKRHLAQTLASLLYRHGHFTLFDLGDIGYQHDGVATLFGGVNEGQLLQSVRRFPFQVMVLENIDRASPSVRAKIQSILRSGTCTDPRNRATVRFEHVTLIATIGSTLLGLDDASPPTNAESWQNRLKQTLAADFGLEPTLTGLFNECVVADYPHPMDQARVIALLIRERCELYGLEIDYVAPEILHDEVSRFHKAHGFQLVKTRLEGKLEPFILQAKQNEQKQVILTAPSWNRGITKELSI